MARGHLKGFLTKRAVYQGEGTPTGRGWDVSPGAEAMRRMLSQPKEVQWRHPAPMEKGGGTHGEPMIVPMGERVCFKNLPGAGNRKPSKDSTIHGRIFIPLNSPSSSHWTLNRSYAAATGREAGKQEGRHTTHSQRQVAHPQQAVAGGGRERGPTFERRMKCVFVCYTIVANFSVKTSIELE